MPKKELNLQEVLDHWNSLYDSMSGQDQRFWGPKLKDEYIRLGLKIRVLSGAPCPKCDYFQPDVRRNGSIGLSCKRKLSPVTLAASTPDDKRIQCSLYEPAK